MDKSKEGITRGSGNVFEDLGVTPPENIMELIDKMGGDELLPCPFCGGGAKVGGVGGHGSYGFVKCTNSFKVDCHAEIRGAYESHAIERWNRRTASKTPQWESIDSADAELRDWVILGHSETKFRISGVIYNDSKGCFEDGTDVMTSRLIEVNFKLGYAQTLNTRYKLIGGQPQAEEE